MCVSLLAIAFLRSIRTILTPFWHRSSILLAPFLQFLLELVCDGRTNAGKLCGLTWMLKLDRAGCEGLVCFPVGTGHFGTFGLRFFGPSRQEGEP